MRHFIWALVLLLIQSVSDAATYSTRNFTITTNVDDQSTAQVICQAAEAERERSALYWTGRVLPNWSSKCPIEANVGTMGAGGGTTFVIRDGEVFGWKMKVQGNLHSLLYNVIPHEVSHTVFYSEIRAKIARWADEGAATSVELPGEQLKQEHLFQQVEGTPRQYTLTELMTMMEYPQDMTNVLTLYAQGHSVSSFLIALNGPRDFYETMKQASQGDGWEESISDHYGFTSIDELQHRWQSWRNDGADVTVAYQYCPNGRCSPRQCVPYYQWTPQPQPQPWEPVPQRQQPQPTPIVQQPQPNRDRSPIVRQEIVDPSAVDDAVERWMSQNREQLRGPQGPKGDKGVDGINGLPGLPGQPAKEVTIDIEALADAIASRHGDQLKGADGKSVSAGDLKPMVDAAVKNAVGDLSQFIAYPDDDQFDRWAQVWIQQNESAIDQRIQAVVIGGDEAVGKLQGDIETLRGEVQQLRQELKQRQTPVSDGRILYFTSTQGCTNCSEPDKIVKALRAKGVPITVIDLEPSQTKVDGVPRLHIPSLDRTIGGKESVVKFLSQIER